MVVPQFVYKNKCNVTGLKDWFDTVIRWHDGLV
jgi:hypothetical protein